MSMLTVRVTPEIKARLGAEARRLHTTRSELVRRLIEDGLDAAEGASADITCADLMGDLIGCVDSGIPDSATNSKYIEEVIVADYERDLRRLAP
ncbi:MAG: ribbon-helix-helix protein, CopG family [Acidimicrobiaceae bacterium]|nr:ribbon-helix-helix protein, CopG family [Acidimicrobiaceae bacterium]